MTNARLRQLATAIVDGLCAAYAIICGISEETVITHARRKVNES